MKEETLRRIEFDIAASDLGRARDRLHGLIATYPNDLALRLKLGQAYWHLQYPSMAGRYWYLEEEKSPTMTAACQAFERSCGNDPVKVLHALKFRGDIEGIRDTFAGRQLLELQARAAEEYGYTIEFGKSGRERYQYTRWSGSRGKLVLVAFVVVSLLAVGLMIVGLLAVLRWIF
ncbi:DUF6584 family protein [Chloroflexota bacterium]